jgi:endonuclease YncB( thermonuclease family)
MSLVKVGTSGLPGFKALQVQVRKVLAEGVERAQRAVEQERIRTYWELGGVLDEYLAEHGAGYGEQVFKRVAQENGLTASLVYESVRFRRQTGNLHTCVNLSWSHYRQVLSIEDTAEREYYLDQASAQTWSVRELVAQIQAAAYQGGLKSIASESVETMARVIAKRGELHTYRVAEKSFRRFLDLGCRTYLPLEPGWEDFETGALVRSVVDGRTVTGFRLEVATSRRKLYTFVAQVTDVIDGDTIRVLLDLGFGVFSEQKLRLRGIDTPEMDSVAGREARSFLAQALGEADRIVVTTTKVDLYDRYLADVFVLGGEMDPGRIARDGVFVNRELVRVGMARVWVG